MSLVTLNTLESWAKWPITIVFVHKIFTFWDDVLGINFLIEKRTNM
jgi:hypothetical protein